MALPSSGSLTLAQIQTEFGGVNPISLSEYYRNGGLVTSNNTNVPTSGVISLSNFFGAVKLFQFTISTTYTTTQDLRSLALAAGWNGADPVLATVSSGVLISSSTTASAALTVSGSFPAGVSLVNNGSIVGMGGQGANADSVGNAGGAAIAVSTAISITNNGILAGGGGGGGAGISWGWNGLNRSTPGSAGGSGLTQAIAPGPLYPGTSVGGQASQYDSGTGMYSTPGASQNWGYGGRVSSYGGAGGTWGNQGQQGGNIDGLSGGGYVGGAGGAAVSGNSNVTWLATGTRYGALS